MWKEQYSDDYFGTTVLKRNNTMFPSPYGRDGSNFPHISTKVKHVTTQGTQPGNLKTFFSRKMNYSL